MGMLYGRTSDNKAVRPLSTSTLPILINGDGAYSGAPAKDEDPQYPMTNLYSPNRYRVWSTKVGTADTSILVQLDLAGGANGANQGGTDKTVSSAGLLGLRGHAGKLAPFNIAVGYRTRAQGYSATGYTATTPTNTVGLQNRDDVLQFDQASARYWQFNFSIYDVAGFSLGNFWLGVLQDLGLFWSADGGATWEDDHNVLLTPTAGGHTDAVARGDAGATYTLTFRAIDNAKRATLLSHFGSNERTKPLLILDENNVPRQFFVINGPQFSQVFDGVYIATLNLVRLG